MSEYNIRPATPADTDTLVKIALNEWKAIYEGYRQQMGDELYFTFFPDCNADKEGQIRKNVSDGNCFVTECDGKIAGFITCLYSESKKIGTISNNAVSAEFRGKGIGPRQYEFVFDRLRSLGAIAVMVTTGLDEAHAPARRAYEKVGFSANTKKITYYKKL